MTSALTAQDLGEINALVVEWAWRLDHGEGHGVLDLLTADARVDLFGEEWEPAQLRGRVDIRASRPERRTHHQLTNVRVLGAGPNRATGHVGPVLRAVNAPDEAPTVEYVGEYRDAYRCVAGRWRFKRRVLAALGSGDV